MQLKRLPLFKSHHSIGKSILTLDDPKNTLKDGPHSIIKLCLDHDLKEFYLVEDGMGGFLEAYTMSKSHGLKLRYGLRITMVNNINEKTEESLRFSHKIIIFVKSNNGYRLLNKIFTEANKSGFYREPRIDQALLENFWSNNDLALAIPFYDSQIFNNTLKFGLCCQSFKFCENGEIYFLEDNKLWFDQILLEKVREFCAAEKKKCLFVQSVYYSNHSDFKAYLTFKCINERNTLNKPELEHMSSNTFCLDNCFLPSDIIHE